MLKLRLPRIVEPPTASPPVILERAPLLLLRRREFLKGLAALLVALSMPVTTFQRAVAAARGRFFTKKELATLAAVCDRILPPDADPGAKTLGAATYIDRLLAAFDHRVPTIFAGGPFSNRNPFPNNADGTPGRKRPKNAFKRFLPLNRLQDIRWRAELFGSESLYAGKTDATSLALQALDTSLGGPLPGLRDLYRDGLAKLDDLSQTSAGARFVDLTTAQQDLVLKAADGDRTRFPVDPRRGEHFITILIRHTLEGCFSAPEYGGNKASGGWTLVGIEGDDQPLGFSIFDQATNSYNERADHPMSTPNPDELGPGGVVVPKPLSTDGQNLTSLIATLSGIFGDECPVS